MDDEVPPTTEEVRERLERVLGPSIAAYELQQVNGQRKLFNPFMKDKFAPPEGSEVFIGRLPRDLYEDELVPAFLQIGPFYEMRLMLNFSGTNRGFAFVCYFNKEVAAQAIAKLDNYEVRRGQFIGVTPSVNNRRLELKNLPFSHVNIGWIKQLIEGIEDIKYRPVNRFCNGVFSRSLCATIVFSSHRAAAMARRMLIPMKEEMFGTNTVIDWAVPFQCVERSKPDIVRSKGAYRKRF